MLVLHSSSRCDVCFIEYSWEDTAKKPHAIACGHIFCRTCLYSTEPPLCPLCRKAYQPPKIKRLHVDKPDAMDENKEQDLLQRLGLAWECSPELFKNITEEVDAWLQTRPEDVCIPLRRARVALRKHSELQAFTQTLHGQFVELQQQHQSLKIDLQREQQKGLVQAEANSTMIDSLKKEILKLNYQLQGMLAMSQGHSHRHKSRNPLPPPPEPISTDKVPTFQQAMERDILESGAAGYRPIDLPTSPYRQPSDVENYGHKKGKSKQDDPWSEKEKRYQSASTSELQEEVSVPPIPSSSSYHVHPHSSSPQSLHHHPAYSTVGATRASALPVFTDPHVPNIFGVVGGYLKEYTSGYLNGQEAALGQRFTEEWNRKETRGSSKHTSSRSRRHTEQFQHTSTPRAHDPNSTNRHTSSVTNGVSQDSPPPHSTRERSPRSSHRHETAPSIISSSAASSRNGGPSPTSQARSGGIPPVPVHHVQTTVTSPVGYSVAPSEPVLRSPSPRSSVDAPLPAPLPVQPQLIIPQPPVPVPTPTSYRPPSIMSHQTQPSIDTWGTAPPSHLASGSLVSGLLGLRDGAEQIMVGGDGSFVFRELNSHGSSIRSRNSIAIETIDAVLEAPNPNFSPSRPVQTMVGVLPDEEAAPPYIRSPREGERPPPSYRPRSQIYSPNYDHYQPLPPANGFGRHNGSSRYYNDPDSQRSSYASSRGYLASYEDQQSLASSMSSLALQGPPASRLQPLALPEESPLPSSMQYTYTDSEDGEHHGRASRAGSIEETMESFDNALGLNLRN